MMQYASLRAGAILLVLLLVGGCAAAPPKVVAPPLDGTAWIASEVDGRKVGKGAPTLAFETGQAAGSDGCNRYRVGWRTDGASLRFELPAATTRVGCPPAENALADAWQSVLAATAGHARIGEQLELRDAEGRRLALLVTQPLTLSGTRWRVDAIASEGAMTGLPAGIEATLVFDDATGRASGSAGCNQFSAAVASDAAGLRFGPIGTSKRLCAEPATVMAVESAYVAALARVASARREGARLELRAADGGLVVSLSRMAD